MIITVGPFAVDDMANGDPESGVSPVASTVNAEIVALPELDA